MTSAPSPAPAAGAPAADSWWRQPRTWVATTAVLLALAGAWAWHARGTAQAQPRYVTEVVNRGDLSVNVSANGTLQPTNKAAIGSELSGTVAQVYVDVNDRVRKGQVLLELDASKLRDQVARSTAALGVAQANLRQAQATVTEAADNVKRLQEVQRLSGGKVPSASELAGAEATLARANAARASAEAGVADAAAAVRSDQTNLRKASIRAPFDGVILARNVDPGNAVAASLQAVTLFTIAEDLARMKLEVNVDEADVGAVRAGQAATFTVSAYPTRNYPARVTRVSYGSTTKDNVVTYEADLLVDNRDLTLRPGMSANASVLVSERHGVLLVPNTALRFSPGDLAQAPADGAGEGLAQKLLPRIPRQGTPRKAGTSTAGARQVWVLQQGRPVAVAVTPGVSDGRLTEVASDTLQAGMAVITDQARSTR